MLPFFVGKFMKLYIANCSRQPHTFNYKLPEKTQSFGVTIPSGRQHMIENQSDIIDHIIRQHEPYGFQRCDKVDKNFSGICYSIDKPVSVGRIEDCAEQLRPSLEGFIRFVREDMKVPVHAIADDDPTLECCFQSAMELIPHDQGLERLSIIYVRTVYNAAASFLLNFAPGSWFADLRKKLNLGKLATGLVSAAADQGTSGSITISDALSNLSLLDLQMLQDPYGRQVVAVLMQMGTVWGYTP